MPELMVDNLCISLNRTPGEDAENRLALLPQGRMVTAVGSSTEDGWIMVQVDLGGESVTGYVQRRFLTAPEEFDDWLPPQRGVTEVHMRTGHPGARRDNAANRPFPLSETPLPLRDVEADDATRAAQLTRIVEWLDVENSARYRPGNDTYCNIYAYDFCYLARAYLPRVWWSVPAIARLEQGQSVTPYYAETVTEQQANQLFHWLNDYGPSFGWRRVFSVDEAQDAVNRGSVGVICARRHGGNGNGHMSVMVPETATHEADRREDGTVNRPLHSEAGRNVRQYSTETYWLNEDRFQEYGIWLHP